MKRYLLIGLLFGQSGLIAQNNSEELFRGQYLEKLSLEKSTVTQDVLESLSKLQFLSDLDLSNVTLEDVTWDQVLKVVSKLERLKRLKLSDNPILLRLPESFKELQKLEMINIRGTDIQIPERSVLVEEWGGRYSYQLNGKTVNPTFPKILLQLPALRTVYISRFTDYINQAIDGIIAKRIDVRNGDGDPLIYYVVRSGNLDLVKRVYAAYPWQRDFKIGRLTLFTFALQQDKPEIAQYLLSVGSQVSSDDLVTAARYCPSMVEQLLQKGANINQQDQAGQTALIVAANKGNLALVNLLISKGAKVALEDALGDNAFFKALKSSEGKLEDRLAIMRALLKADPSLMNQVGEYGYTPLTYIASKWLPALAWGCFRNVAGREDAVYKAKAALYTNYMRFLLDTRRKTDDLNTNE